MTTVNGSTNMQTIPTLFQCDSWKDTPVSGPAEGLVQGTLEGKYIGDDIKGDVVCLYAMAPYGPTAKAKTTESLMRCRFDGQQLFNGTVLGKKGSFIAREAGEIKDGFMTAEFNILTETATGELVGIKGTSSYKVSMEKEGVPVPGELQIEMPKA